MSRLEAAAEQKPEKLKHPPSAFLLYCKDHRDYVQQRCPELSANEMTQLLSQLWKGLDPAQKDQYEMKRQVLVERFEKLKPHAKPAKASADRKGYPMLQPNEIFRQNASERQTVDRLIGDILRNRDAKD